MQAQSRQIALFPRAVVRGFTSLNPENPYGRPQIEEVFVPSLHGEGELAQPIVQPKLEVLPDKNDPNRVHRHRTTHTPEYHRSFLKSFELHRENPYDQSMDRILKNAKIDSFDQMEFKQDFATHIERIEWMRKNLAFFFSGQCAAQQLGKRGDLYFLGVQRHLVDYAVKKSGYQPRFG